MANACATEVLPVLTRCGARRKRSKRRGAHDLRCLAVPAEHVCFIGGQVGTIALPGKDVQHIYTVGCN
ncbi:hypothetical protein F01_50132 [Burkholderia cenocepacia]|nr:hypothetical protein F01_50132 [Burkholderia cenocepacia]